MIARTAFATLILLLSQTCTNAEQLPRDNAVRTAALERLKDKLGAMRGTIDLKQRGILVTNKMIERLKPIQSKNNNASEAQTGRELIATPSKVKTIAGDPEQE